MELNPDPCFNKNVLDWSDYTTLNVEMLQINTFVWLGFFYSSNTQSVLGMSYSYSFSLPLYYLFLFSSIIP